MGDEKTKERAFEGYFVDTNGGAITVTTPASPSVGDEFILVEN